MPTEILKDGHKNFKNEFQKRETFFKNLATAGQKPKVLWIGCSDSRVIPAYIMSASPGDIFTHRNIANIIPPNDSGENCTSAVIEFAVKNLKVEHIVICGHTECGGIKAILSDQSNAEDVSLNNWLKYAMPAKEDLIQNNPHIKPDYIETIKQNVLVQKNNLMKYEYVKSKYDAGELLVHSWLFDLHSGLISSYNSQKKIWEVLD